MIDSAALLGDLRSLTSALVDDLRNRSESVSEVGDFVAGQYREARTAGRTDRSLEEWREDLLAQIAVAWVLASVFVRFCEDNELFDPPLLSGAGDRRRLAGDHRADWLAAHPAAGDREWLEEVFGRYRAVPALAELFGEHNALWEFGPTADGAKQILELWRSTNEETGRLVHDFTDLGLDTRFLGDLYQDLSDHAKKTFALLQTPKFVEEFILDRTLDPAIDTFGLDEVRMIDPTCGSGHFLLGAFDRLLDRWRAREPGTPIRELAQRALDAVNGVDLNPFAAAIARFRLLVAALRASGITRLVDAPAFRINIAVGDSLLHGRRGGELFAGVEGMDPLLRHRYPTEDEEWANELLESGRYHAVVGNPPYITVKDKALRDAYRVLYDTCHGKYSLGVPFTERFVDLAATPRNAGEGGYLGLITTNTFMKRSFGRKLVEEYLPQVDVTHIVDTTGVHIPGHGTPTVVIFGRHQAPSASTVRAVLGIRSQSGIPEDPAAGEVWRSILDLVDRPGTENDYISVEDAPRERFSTHPWSLQGGAAPQTKAAIERGTSTLEPIARAIGITAVTGEDDLYVAADAKAFGRYGIGSSKRLVIGEQIRDWRLSGRLAALWPYDAELQLKSLIELAPALKQRLWLARTGLSKRKRFGTPMLERGAKWWEWQELYVDKLRTSLSITFAFVATHNHFVFDRGGKVCNRSAPVIKLPEAATEDEHLKLLGLLNSSTACFWMKQVFHDKGKGGYGGGIAEEPWERFYEFDGTKLLQFPIPADSESSLARELDAAAQALAATLPAEVLEGAYPSRARLDEARARAEDLRRREIALQDELDWRCYALYGLTKDELTAPAECVPPLEKGQRAFEIVLARRMAAGEVESTWFERHGSTPITELPANWPAEYRSVVEHRIELIEKDRAIRLLERPEYKRRWNWEEWETLEKDALKGWLLDRLESRELWAEPRLTTTARLADRMRHDPEFLQAARLYAGRVDVDLAELVTKLVEDEAVPFAAGYRYRPSGRRKRKAWEAVWEQQRAEDAIDARTELDEDDPRYLSESDAEAAKKEQALDRIPVPPKYGSADFASSSYWRLRGKLDVPKERFVLLPGTHLGSDSTPVVGWAGRDDLVQAQALAAHYSTRKNEGAEEPELTGLLAGLQELVPWLLQWHNRMDPKFGHRMGDFFATFVDTEARTLGLTVRELEEWTPA